MLWAPTSRGQQNYLSPTDLWSTEPVNPTLYDPEAGRA